MKPKERKPLTAEQATARLEAMAARAEHCSREMLNKLALWGLDSHTSQTIVDDLRKRRFIDDERYTRAFVNDKIRFARWGRRKIKSALYAKGLPSDVINIHLDSIDMDEYELILTDLLMAKARTIDDPNTYEGRTKLFRFGVSRGFEPEIVVRIVKETFV